LTVLVQEHLDKAGEFEAARSLLDVEEDHELAVWCLMQAGTHYVNAAFHRLGLNAEARSFPSSVVLGRYFVPAGGTSGRGWCEVEPVEPADLLHAYTPPLDLPGDGAPARLLALLFAIEQLAKANVRAAVQPTAAERGAGFQAFHRLREDCLRITRAASQGEARRAR
jgi:hypothetical protein